MPDATEKPITKMDIAKFLSSCNRATQSAVQSYTDFLTQLKATTTSGFNNKQLIGDITRNLTDLMRHSSTLQTLYMETMELTSNKEG